MPGRAVNRSLCLVMAAEAVNDVPLHLVIVSRRHPWWQIVQTYNEDHGVTGKLLRPIIKAD